jgi:hypothetical protein
MQLPDATKHTVDALSIATVIGTIASWLPSIAALFTIVWTGIRIYETDTCQKWLWKGKKRRSP